MSDLIDRQAAIAYAISGRVRTLPTSEDGENWIRTEDVRQSLLTMPSAEPERIVAKQILWMDIGTIGRGRRWVTMTLVMDAMKTAMTTTKTKTEIG